MTSGSPGSNVTLLLSFYDETSGSLTDPDSVTLDITYGTEVGLVPDTAGPFTYYGSASAVPGIVYRTGTGQYAFIWSIPAGTEPGVYVANWTCTYDGDNFLGVENFTVTGTYQPPVPAGDTGFWTGSLAYVPSAGNTAVLAGSAVELGAVDSNGIAWLLQKVEGWDGPDVQGGGVLAKSGDHGAFPSPQFYAARAITLTITASAPTQALRDLARSLLQQVVPISDLCTFTYDEPIPKQAQVRRSGKITETYPTLADVTFSVALIAPDPRKYSAQQHSVTVVALPSNTIGFTSPFTSPFTPPAQPPAGAAAITNAGDFESRPVITIQGPVTAPTLANVTTGQIVSFSQLVLGATDELEVDFTVAQARLNGVYRSADLSSSWWTLPPGASTVQLGGQVGSGASMAIAWSDSWQ